jgi:hypothetical protein
MCPSSQVRKQLCLKYGKEFTETAMNNDVTNPVNDRCVPEPYYFTAGALCACLS